MARNPVENKMFDWTSKMRIKNCEKNYGIAISLYVCVFILCDERWCKSSNWDWFRASVEHLSVKVGLLKIKAEIWSRTNYNWWTEINWNRINIAGQCKIWFNRMRKSTINDFYTIFVNYTLSFIFRFCFIFV